MNSYKELIVWQKAMDLVAEIYHVVKLLPREELFCLSDQMRRAAVSIPSNIAEGNSRNSTREYVQFLSIARGSNAELQTQCCICEKLQYATKEQLSKALALTDEIGKMINKLIITLTPNP